MFVQSYYGYHGRSFLCKDATGWFRCATRPLRRLSTGVFPVANASHCGEPRPDSPAVPVGFRFLEFMGQVPYASEPGLRIAALFHAALHPARSDTFNRIAGNSRHMLLIARGSGGKNYGEQRVPWESILNRGKGGCSDFLMNAVYTESAVIGIIDLLQVYFKIAIATISPSLI